MAWVRMWWLELQVQHYMGSFVHSNDCSVAVGEDSEKGALDLET